MDMGIDGVVMFGEDWRGSQTHDWRGPISILEALGCLWLLNADKVYQACPGLANFPLLPLVLVEYQRDYSFVDFEKQNK